MTENNENSTIFTKREYSGKPPRRKRIGVRIAIYLLAACLLAAGVYAATTFLPDKDTNTESESLLNTEILALKPEDVESIIVQNETPFTLNAVAAEPTAQADAEPAVTWQVQGADTAVLNLTSTKSFAESLLTISALRTMTGTDGDYGFPTDGTGITIKMRNGTSHTLCFGEASMDGMGSYMLLDDVNVYVVSASLAEQIEAEPTGFANCTVINALSTEDYPEYVIKDTIAGFDRLEITKKGGATTIITAKKVNDAFEYGMESPISEAVKSDDIDPILSALRSGIKTDEIYGFGILNLNDSAATMTEEEFFAAAEYTLRLKLGETQFELALSGKNTDGNYALVCKGKNATYKLDAATAESWIALAK